MRAIVVRKFGGPFETAEMPVPVPGPGAVQVRMEAAGLGPVDLNIATGSLDGALPHDFPMILGVDGAGTISAVGPGVTRFAVGDRVVGRFLVPPVGHGSFAEYSVLPETATLAHIPDPVTTVAAAALPSAGVTAQSLVDAARIRPGHTVLIVGATGVVGGFLVQLANLAGGHVIATARPADADRMLRLGASETVDHGDGDLERRVLADHPGGVDVVFDLVGPPDARTLSALVREGGSIHVPRLGGTPEGAEDLVRLLRRVATGDVVVPIETTVPLDRAPSLLGVPGARGKTVLAI